MTAGLSDADLVAPTLCAGWFAAYLLVHCRQGLEEHATSLRRHFAAAARGAAGMSRQAGTGSFRSQGHVTAAADILAMWTVGWVVHQLDLTARQPGDRLSPTAQALALAIRTVGELTGGATRPAAGDDARYVLAGTGRVPLTTADQEFLGARAAAFPAFG